MTPHSDGERSSCDMESLGLRGEGEDKTHEGREPLESTEDVEPVEV